MNAFQEALWKIERQQTEIDRLRALNAREFKPLHKDNTDALLEIANGRGVVLNADIDANRDPTILLPPDSVVMYCCLRNMSLGGKS